MSPAAAAPLPPASDEEAAFWFLHLSPDQAERLAALRAELEPSGELAQEPTLRSDLTLLRFLKARQWSVARAAKMYRAMVAWRREERVDELLHTYEFPELPLVRQLYPQFYHKTDRFGRPVLYELVGKIDVDALLRATSMERFIRFHIRECDAFRRLRLPACSAAAGRPILTQTIILDMAGLSATRHFTQKVLSFLQQISHVDQNNFPEHLGTMFFINTPLIFRGFWQVIKGFLDERTLAKIKVLGRDYTAELLAVIPAENLPRQFGGLSPCDAADVGPWQAPEVLAACPELVKAAAAGQLGHAAMLSAASCSSLAASEQGSGGSLIGTSVRLAAGSSSSSLSGC